MKTVRINKTDLLNTLRKNREQHLIDYNDAVVEYRKALVSKLEEMLAKAKDNHTVSHHIDLAKPMSYEDSYNTAISMLDYSVDTVIELDQMEFAQYVEDNWTWNQSFAMSTLSYKKSL